MNFLSLSHGWRTIFFDREVQIIPVGEEEKHSRRKCKCIPRITELEGGDVEYVHRAYDCRHLKEHPLMIMN